MFDENETPGEGHNSDGAVDGGQLRAIAERIDRLEDEKKGIADDIREVYAEAKSQGYDTKVLRKAIARARRDRNEVLEEDAILDLYSQAIGVFS